MHISASFRPILRSFFSSAMELLQVPSPPCTWKTSADLCDTNAVDCKVPLCSRLLLLCRLALIAGDSGGEGDIGKALRRETLSAHLNHWRSILSPVREAGSLSLLAVFVSRITLFCQEGGPRLTLSLRLPPFRFPCQHTYIPSELPRTSSRPPQQWLSSEHGKHKLKY